MKPAIYVVQNQKLQVVMVTDDYEQCQEKLASMEMIENEIGYMSVWVDGKCCYNQ